MVELVIASPLIKYGWSGTNPGQPQGTILMDSYQLIVEHWDSLKLHSKWSEAHGVLERIAIKEPRDWRLPVLACEAVGGSPDE